MHVFKNVTPVTNFQHNKNINKQVNKFLKTYKFEKRIHNYKEFNTYLLNPTNYENGFGASNFALGFPKPSVEHSPSILGPGFPSSRPRLLGESVERSSIPLPVFPEVKNRGPKVDGKPRAEGLGDVDGNVARILIPYGDPKRAKLYKGLFLKNNSLSLKGAGDLISAIYPLQASFEGCNKTVTYTKLKQLLKYGASSRPVFPEPLVDQREDGNRGPTVEKTSVSRPPLPSTSPRGIGGEFNLSPRFFTSAFGRPKGRPKTEDVEEEYSTEGRVKPRAFLINYDKKAELENTSGLSALKNNPRKMLSYHKTPTTVFNYLSLHGSVRLKQKKSRTFHFFQTLLTKYFFPSVNARPLLPHLALGFPSHFQWDRPSALGFPRGILDLSTSPSKMDGGREDGKLDGKPRVVGGKGRVSVKKNTVHFLLNKINNKSFLGYWLLPVAGLALKNGAFYETLVKLPAAAPFIVSNITFPSLNRSNNLEGIYIMSNTLSTFGPRFPSSRQPSIFDPRFTSGKTGEVDRSSIPLPPDAGYSFNNLYRYILAKTTFSNPNNKIFLTSTSADEVQIQNNTAPGWSYLNKISFGRRYLQKFFGPWFSSTVHPWWGGGDRKTGCEGSSNTFSLQAVSPSYSKTLVLNNNLALPVKSMLYLNQILPDKHIDFKESSVFRFPSSLPPSALGFSPRPSVDRREDGKQEGEYSTEGRSVKPRAEFDLSMYSPSLRPSVSLREYSTSPPLHRRWTVDGKTETEGKGGRPLVCFSAYGLNSSINPLYSQTLINNNINYITAKNPLKLLKIKITRFNILDAYVFRPPTALRFSPRYKEALNLLNLNLKKKIKILNTSFNKINKTYGSPFPLDLSKHVPYPIGDAPILNHKKNKNHILLNYFLLNLDPRMASILFPPTGGAKHLSSKSGEYPSVLKKEGGFKEENQSLTLPHSLAKSVLPPSYNIDPVMLKLKLNIIKTIIHPSSLLSTKGSGNTQPPPSVFHLGLRSTEGKTENGRRKLERSTESRGDSEPKNQYKFLNLNDTVLSIRQGFGVQKVSWNKLNVSQLPRTRYKKQVTNPAWESLIINHPQNGINLYFKYITTKLKKYIFFNHLDASHHVFRLPYRRPLQFSPRETEGRRWTAKVDENRGPFHQKWTGVRGCVPHSGKPPEDYLNNVIRPYKRKILPIVIKSNQYLNNLALLFKHQKMFKTTINPKRQKAGKGTIFFGTSPGFPEPSDFQFSPRETEGQRWRGFPQPSAELSPRETEGRREDGILDLSTVGKREDGILDLSTVGKREDENRGPKVDGKLHLQKKRKAKKLRLETRRQKKRTRFFPRPMWLRYRMFLNFLTQRKNPRGFETKTILKRMRRFRLPFGSGFPGQFSSSRPVFPEGNRGPSIFDGEVERSTEGPRETEGQGWKGNTRPKAIGDVNYNNLKIFSLANAQNLKRLKSTETDKGESIKKIANNFFKQTILNLGNNVTVPIDSFPLAFGPRFPSSLWPSVSLGDNSSCQQSWLPRAKGSGLRSSFPRGEKPRAEGKTKTGTTLPLQNNFQKNKIYLRDIKIKANYINFKNQKTNNPPPPVEKDKNTMFRDFWVWAYNSTLTNMYQQNLWSLLSNTTSITNISYNSNITNVSSSPMGIKREHLPSSPLVRPLAELSLRPSVSRPPLVEGEYSTSPPLHRRWTALGFPRGKLDGKTKTSLSSFPRGKPRVEDGQAITRLNWALHKTNNNSFTDFNQRYNLWSTQKLRNQSKNNKTKALEKQYVTNWEKFFLNKSLNTFSKKITSKLNQKTQKLNYLTNYKMALPIHTGKKEAFVPTFPLQVRGEAVTVPLFIKRLGIKPEVTKNIKIFNVSWWSNLNVQIPSTFTFGFPQRIRGEEENAAYHSGPRFFISGKTAVDRWSIPLPPLVDGKTENWAGNNSSLVIGSSVLLHLCALISLVSISQVRCFVKFHLILLYKLSTSYNLLLQKTSNYVLKVSSAPLLLETQRGRVKNQRINNTYFNASVPSKVQIENENKAKLLTYFSLNLFKKRFTQTTKNTSSRSITKKTGFSGIKRYLVPLSSSIYGTKTLPFWKKPRLKTSAIVNGLQVVYSKLNTISLKAVFLNKNSLTFPRSGTHILPELAALGFPSNFPSSRPPSIFDGEVERSTEGRGEKPRAEGTVTLLPGREIEGLSTVGGREDGKLVGGNKSLLSKQISSYTNLNSFSLRLTTKQTKFYCTSRTNILLKESKNRFFKGIFNVIDLFQISVRKIEGFFEKPAEFTTTWIAYGFLVEWSSDLITIMPENIDIYIWNSFAKVSRIVQIELILNANTKTFLKLTNITAIQNFPVLLTISHLIHRRILYLFDLLIETISQPDADLITRQEKGTLFWDIWADFLVTAADYYNVNVAALSTIKAEQNTLIENISNDFENLALTFGPYQKVSTNIKIKKTKRGILVSAGLRPSVSLMECSTSPVFPEVKNRGPKARGIRGEVERSTSPRLPFGPRFPSGNTRPKAKKDGLSHFQWDGKPRDKGGRELLKSAAFSIKSNMVPSLLANLNRWSVNQYITYQSWHSHNGSNNSNGDLFIDYHPPKSFSHIPAIKSNSILQQPIGTLVCQIYSGIFNKQISKNILLVNTKTNNSNKIGQNNFSDYNVSLIQALAGETELKIITDNAQRYAIVNRGFAIGIKLLRDVFDAIALNTPCIFLLEDIHAIGERRPMLISDSGGASADDNGSFKEDFFGSQRDEVHEKNQVVYQLTRHSITHYQKPFKGDYSLAIPTNLFVTDLFLKYPTQSPSNLTLIESHNLTIKNKIKNPLMSISDIFSSKQIKSSKNTHLQIAQISSNFAPPSTSPFSVLLLKEEKKLKPNKIVEELPWTGLPSEQLSTKPRTSYSIRAKVAMLAELSLSNVSAKLDMITDLLVIIDSVRSNKGFVVFATTDVPHILDPALRRPGRLDETICLPNIGNSKILKFNTTYEIIKSIKQTKKSSLTVNIKDYNIILGKAKNLNNTAAITGTSMSLPIPKYYENSSLNYALISHSKNLKRKKTSSLLCPVFRFPVQFSSSRPVFPEPLVDQREDGNRGPSIFDGEVERSSIPLPPKVDGKPRAEGPFTSSIFPSPPFPVGDVDYPTKVGTKNRGLRETSPRLPFGRVFPFHQRWTVNRGPKAKVDGLSTLGGRKDGKLKTESSISSRLHKKTKDKTIVYYEVGKVLLNHYLTGYGKTYCLDSNSLNLKSINYLSLYGSKNKLLLQLMLIFGGKIGQLLGSKNRVNSIKALQSHNKKPSSHLQSGIHLTSPRLPFGRVFPEPLVDQREDGNRGPLHRRWTAKVDVLSTSPVGGIGGREDGKLDERLTPLSPQGDMETNLLDFDMSQIFERNENNPSGMKMATSIIRSFIHKRYLYRKNLIVPKLLSFTDGNILEEPPCPPFSSLLIPAKRFENYKRLFKDLIIGDKMGQRKAQLSFSEKLQYHMQFRSIKLLNNIKQTKASLDFNPNLTVSPSSIPSSRPPSIFDGEVERSTEGGKGTAMGLNKIASVFPEGNRGPDNILQTTTNINWYYQNRILKRHGQYLTNQWWNGQLSEHNAETVFLSDIDWRSSFIKNKQINVIKSSKLSVFRLPVQYSPRETEGQGWKGRVFPEGNRGPETYPTESGMNPCPLLVSKQKKSSDGLDVLLDFPDTDQYYNPRRRRWLLNKGYWGFWFNFDKVYSEKIISTWILESIIQTYTYLHNNTELLDFVTSKYMGLGYPNTDFLNSSSSSSLGNNVTVHDNLAAYSNTELNSVKEILLTNSFKRF